jgi:hypothetical protein
LKETLFKAALGVSIGAWLLPLAACSRSEAPEAAAAAIDRNFDRLDEDSRTAKAVAARANNARARSDADAATARIEADAGREAQSR